MNQETSHTVEVEIGERDILVLRFKDVLTPEQRMHVQSIMTQIASAPGPQTIVLENMCQVSIIRRDEDGPRIEAVS